MSNKRIKKSCKRTIARFTLATLITVSAVGSVYANCYRHIYNNTTLTWNFDFYATNGNVHAPNQTMNHIILKPQTSVEIEYTNDSLGNIGGNVKITNSNQSYNQVFGYGTKFPRDPCPYIQHSGNTGAVNVNDPADGDFTAWSSSSAK